LKDLLQARWANLQLDATLRPQASSDLDTRRRQLAHERDQSRRHRDQDPGRGPERQRRVWPGSVTAHVAAQTCKPRAQGRPCALVTPTGQCVFARPTPPRRRQHQQLCFGARRPGAQQSWCHNLVGQQRLEAHVVKCKQRSDQRHSALGLVVAEREREGGSIDEVVVCLRFCFRPGVFASAFTEPACSRVSQHSNLTVG